MRLVRSRSQHCCRADTNSEVIVTLSTGKVSGLKLVSAVNKVYYSFQGIPYAAPPIGYLRFKPPRPPHRWNGTLKAYEAPPACSQPWQRVQFPEKYSEDCLYISVFTPYLQPPGDELLPVMVWIHEGKHYQGSATKHKYGADFLMTGEVIVVTFDYRLGVFGFLNMNTKSAQGNAGLKDMVAALKWVQKEIRHFGGNPKKVTIFGGSSGAQDVSCLYLSPLSQGLFHRAISQSGQYCGTSNNINTVLSSRTLARLLGCDYRKPEAVVACLRGITAQVLAERQMEVATQEPGDPENPFLQSVEEDHGEEVMIPVDPSELLQSSTSKVPYLMGLNTGEGIMEIKDLQEYPNQFSDFERDFEKYLPYNIKEKSSKKALQYIIKKLKKFYFHNKNVTVDTIDGFIDFMTDKMFMYSIVTHAKYLSNHTNVFLYLFAYKGAFEEPLKITKDLNLTGVVHGRELGYMFYRPTVIETQSHMSDYPQECEMVTKMVTLWTNFARYGSPTPVDDAVLGATWLPVNGSLTQHLVINSSLTMDQTPLYSARVAMWDEVYLIAEQDIAEASWSIAIMIVTAVCVLSVSSLTFLLYDCCCRKRDQYQVLE
ncbi:juvenile hormone esterase-like [Macrosteles quadrilineatus]|uniref:juvenile hormone esterase-like n=1 Tax=Macrosteles quadrilineatus TaxID=74068 RepID=UPI0023E20803|nr:juvenile hormone esterase-like [Macrosteles quadrilineatus]